MFYLTMISRRYRNVVRFYFIGSWYCNDRRIDNWVRNTNLFIRWSATTMNCIHGRLHESCHVTRVAGTRLVLHVRTLVTGTFMKMEMHSFCIGSWVHIFLLRKVRKLFWLRDRSFLWMVWQLTLLPWGFCWGTTQRKLPWLVLLPLLYCRRRGSLFEQYTGKGVRIKDIDVLIKESGDPVSLSGGGGGGGGVSGRLYNFFILGGSATRSLSYTIFTEKVPFFHGLFVLSM